MKSQTLPTKRKPVSKGVFRKLSAVTRGRRKQRATTTASSRDFEDGENSARIGRALLVILLIHLLAVAMIFVHHRFLSDRPAEQATAKPIDVKLEAPASVVPQATAEHGVVSSQLATDEKPYIVAKGDSYASIAAAHQIAESDLRQLNDNANIRLGYLLKIPVKRVVIKTPRPMLQAQTIMVRSTVNEDAPPVVPVRDQGLVEAIDTRNAPRAVQIAQGGSADGKYVVQKGDTIWRIATRHGVDQKKLMEANGISDARKLRLGMTLKIP